MSLVDQMKQNPRLWASVLSVIISSLIIYIVFYIVYYVSGTYLIALIAIPAVVFTIMHYLGLYGVKKRVIHGFFIFIVLSIVVVLSTTQIIYNYNGQFNGIELGNGTAVDASVTPYSGIHPSYNFSFDIHNNVSFSTYGLSISSLTSQTFSTISVNQTQMHSISINSTHRLIYYESASLPQGMYEFTFYINNSSNLNDTFTGTGPITSINSLMEIQFLSLFISYMILFNLVFITGTFVAKSIENSRARAKMPPRHGTP